MFLKGWNSDTARPEKGMHFVLFTLLFKDTDELVKKSCRRLEMVHELLQHCVTYN